MASEFKQKNMPKTRIVFHYESCSKVEQWKSDGADRIPTQWFDSEVEAHRFADTFKPEEYVPSGGDWLQWHWTTDGWIRYRNPRSFASEAERLDCESNPDNYRETLRLEIEA